ncbi:TPA: PAS domain-containing protein [Escherichia coli]|nr:PAS domain-containing protein [Escherichia coli]HAV9028458.1 PAS domain-containing protein [Escherichia coli]HAW2960616.1 PAS domain-containing protein [Escherichia coli]HAW4019129.1 PAS domain-containing protein [Escherichia coli]HAW4112608.1 PAS domain-containing protein [Escherichia coli]
MCALDPRERPRNSQSVNKYILSVQDIYRNSPVPVCVRNQNRKILYANGAFIELFSKEDQPLSGESYIRYQVEVYLSSLELECQSLGHGSAFCRRFNFHGEIYQIRMENVSFDSNESVVLWQINLFPDYPFFLKNDYMKKIAVAHDNFWLNELSPGTLIVFAMYMFGVGHATIARELGITIRASEDRIKPMKRKVKTRYAKFDLFRISLITSNEFTKLIDVIREYYNIK